ncbi:MAG: siphovirus ReqiPepy6 Gp37-like family protein [bacterium]
MGLCYGIPAPVGGTTSAYAGIGYPYLLPAPVGGAVPAVSIPTITLPAIPRVMVLAADHGRLPGWTRAPVMVVVDGTQIDTPLYDFPLELHLSAAAGITNTNLAGILTDLGSSSLKIAVTADDGMTQHSVEVVAWDPVAKTATLRVRVPLLPAGIDTALYLYHDPLHADNTSYVGETGSDPADAVMARYAGHVASTAWTDAETAAAADSLVTYAAEPSPLYPVAALDNFQYLAWTRNWRRPDEWELIVHRSATGAYDLVPGQMIMVSVDGNRRLGIIETRTLQMTRDGKPSETWKVSGRDLGALLGETGRIALDATATGDGYDERTGDGETLMHHFVDANAINPADARRGVPFLTLAANNHRGSSCTYAARFQQLAAILEEIALATGLGWSVPFDFSTFQAALTVQRGYDRTFAQTENARAIFSTVLGTALVTGYTESTRTQTVNYLGGQGEGGDREVVAYGGPMVRSIQDAEVTATGTVTIWAEMVLPSAVACPGLTRENGILVLEVQYSDPADLVQLTVILSSSGSWTSRTWSRVLTQATDLVVGTDYCEVAIPLAAFSELSGTLDPSAISYLAMVAGKAGTDPQTLAWRLARIEYDLGDGIGVSRRESFTDARDLAESNALLIRGAQRAEEVTGTVSLEAQILSGGPYTYREDWDLGDIVHVEYDGVASLDARIVQVREEWDAGSGTTVTATLGTEAPDLVRVLRAVSRKADAEVRR